MKQGRLSKFYSCVWSLRTVQSPEEKQALVNMESRRWRDNHRVFALVIISSSWLTSLKPTVLLYVLSTMLTPSSLPVWHISNVCRNRISMVSQLRSVCSMAEFQHL